LQRLIEWWSVRCGIWGFLGLSLACHIYLCMAQVEQHVFECVGEMFSPFRFWIWCDLIFFLKFGISFIIGGVISSTVCTFCWFLQLFCAIIGLMFSSTFHSSWFVVAVVACVPILLTVMALGKGKLFLCVFEFYNWV